MSSSIYLLFNVNTKTSSVARKDSEFWDLHQYLKGKYVNVLVACLEKNTQDKKFSDSYMKERPIHLTRFLNYCFQSTIVRTDPLFEAFMQDNYVEFEKKLPLLQKKQQPPEKLNELYTVSEDVESISFPDAKKVKFAGSS